MQVSAIRIMIVDNDQGRMDSVAATLKKQADMDVMSIVSTRETAIKQLSGTPDVMLLSPEVLKGHTLSRFIRSVQTKSPGTRVLYLLSSPLPDETIIADIKTGIRGHVSVTDSPSVISRAIHSVQGGEIWAGRRILEKAISSPMLLPETLQSHIPGLPPLTNREMEVLTMVLQGASNKEIANKSSISERTVKTHLYRVYRKLNVKSRTKAIALLSHS
jgi:DNA-binding NarL/FixJ family response regulator